LPGKKMPIFEHDAIVDLVEKKGPCTGLEIKQEIDSDPLLIWRICKTSQHLQVRSLGTRYLRLDRNVDGYARLSPSILREFFTYSVIGLVSDPVPFERRCKEVIDRIHEISRLKFELAKQMVNEIMEEFWEGASERHEICHIIAGDIVYGMAHDVPRPERSTGKLVKGSDIDLVVVVDDDFPDSSINRLDELIYRKKYRMLINPAINEEVDYKIKKLGLIRNQARFDDFKHMVAIKILQEGALLYGSENIYHTVKTIIQENSLPEKLEELEELANIFRNKAEKSILDDSLTKEEIKEMHLFYSAEEFEEFE
jgi:hypothetical protein